MCIGFHIRCSHKQGLGGLTDIRAVPVSLVVHYKALMKVQFVSPDSTQSGFQNWLYKGCCTGGRGASSGLGPRRQLRRPKGEMCELRCTSETQASLLNKKGRLGPRRILFAKVDIGNIAGDGL